MGFKLRPGTSVFGNVTFTPGTNENYVAPPKPRMNMFVGGFAGSKAFLYDANDLTSPPIEVEAPSNNSGMFAHKVAVYGNMIYAADHYNNPSNIHVYDIDDLSSGPTTLTTPSNENTDFGKDMSLDQNHLVVSEQYTNKFFVYDRNNLLAEPYQGSTSGSSGPISSSGDIIVIGSNAESPRGNYSGRAYVFNKNIMTNGGTGTPYESISPSDGSTFDFFGTDVATDGNIIAVSAFRDNESGSVYIYGVGDYNNYQYKLTGPGWYTTDNSNFGYSLDFSDNHLVVGSPGKNSSKGAVWVYDKNNLSLSPVQLMPSDLDDHDRFGESVAINNDVIVVGARRDDDAGPDLGAVYVYDATDLLADPIKITNDNAQTEFGWTVAVDPS
jgi:hypothetical protein